MDVGPEGKTYALNLIPERRKDDAKLERVNMKLGGPVASRIASRLFGDDVARLILKYGMGQTLNLDQSQLMSSAAASRALNFKEGSAEEKALDLLLKGFLE